MSLWLTCTSASAQEPGHMETRSRTIVRATHATSLAPRQETAIAGESGISNSGVNTRSTMAETQVVRRTAFESDGPVMQPQQKPAADPGSGELRAGPVFSTPLSSDDSSLTQLIEMLQWTVGVMLVAVVAAFSLRKYARGTSATKTNSQISHLATLPVRHHFQAHLIEIAGQRFLVTTDRSGVKTVNPVTGWGDFEAPVSNAPAA